MDQQAGDTMNFKAVLLEALPPETATNVRSMEELKERAARRRRRRHSTVGTLGVLAVVLPLLIFALLPFGTSNHRQPIRPAGPAHESTPMPPKAGLTRLTLPGSFTGYATQGPIAISPNGRTAYVGDPQIGLVTPIDLPSGRARRPIRLGRWGISAIAITPSGRTAYVVEGGTADEIVPIDLATSTVRPAIHVAGPRALGSSIAITPDGHMAYVDSMSENDFRHTATGSLVTTHITPSYVVPINLMTNKALRPVSLSLLSVGGHIVQSEEPMCETNCAFDETIGGIVITANGRIAYVSQDGDVQGGIVPIDLSTERVGPNISIPEGAVAEPLAITPDGRTVYIAGNGSVSPIDLASNTVGSSIRVVPAGELVSAMTVTPDGVTLVVDGDPEVAAVNLQSRTVKSLLDNHGEGNVAIAPRPGPTVG
jgi:hypothetical protein